MGMIRNYFADLELGIDSSLDDVKKAYKRLARRFHPDVNPFDVQAEESFHRIQEAFDRLSSNTRIERFRKQLELASFQKSPKKSFGKWGDYPLVPKPESFVRDWKDESSVKTKTSRRDENLDFWISVSATVSEIASGIKKNIRFKFDSPCSQCRGSGGRSQSVRATCKRCAGLGHFSIERGAMHWKKTCDECRGRGYIVASPCEGCSGRGKVSVAEILELRTPKNLDISRGLVIKGHGHISFDGKRRGDLCVQIVQK